MPVLALEASQVILVALLAVVGAAAFWLVGHTVEQDIDAIGNAGGKLLDPLKKTLLNPGFLIAALVGIFLVIRYGRKGR